MGIALGATIALAASGHAATVTKSASGSDLTNGASWGGSVPSSTDVATWTASSLGGPLTLGSSASWQGIDVSGASSNITLAGGGTLALGSGGISVAGMTLSITNPIQLAAPQTWSAVSGKSLLVSGPISGADSLTIGRAAQSVTSTTFLSTSAQTIFTNTSLASLTSTGGKMGGQWVNLGLPKDAQGYQLSNNGTTATYWIKVLDDVYTKGVQIQLNQVGSDITAKVLAVKYTGGFNLNFDFNTGGTVGTIATSQAAGGYGAHTTTLQYGADTNGLVVLSGANTYTGPTVISRGTVMAGVASVPNVSGAFGNNSPVTLANAPEVAMNLSGYNTQVGSLTGGGGLGGNVQLGTATLTTGGDNSSPAGFAGVISGTGGSVVKIGSGTQTLSGANTYTGGTSILSGRVIAGSNGALGTGPVVLGATASDVALYVADRADLGNDITVSAAGTGSVTLGSTNTANGPYAASFLGTITLNRPTTFDCELITDRTAFDGKITGNVGTLTIIGGARTTFQNTANDFTGNIVLSGQYTLLQASVGTQSEVIPDWCDLTVGVGAAFQLASSSGAETINGLYGAGTVRTYPVSALGSTLIIGGAGGNGDFSGSIVNGVSPLSLTKAGAGTQILSGSNTYTGATTVAAGVLLVNGSLGNTPVTVANGGTLGGSGGTIAGVVTTLGIGAGISPGSSAGTLTLNGGLNISNGASFDFGLGTASDLLVIGSLTGSAAGATVFNLTNNGGLLASTPYTLFDYSSQSGLDYGDFTIGTLPAGFTLDPGFGNGGWLIDTANTRLQVQFIPEPAVSLLAGFGLLGLLMRRRSWVA